MRIFLAVLGTAVLSAPAAHGQDVATGEKAFLQCKTCHQVGESAKNVIGPVLNGLFGRKAGTVEGYSYSEANKNSGITWDEATFREYIKDPKAKVPGTKMIFPGLKDDKRIDDLIAYLKQFDASGKKSAARTPPRPMRAAAAMRDQREDETDEAAADTAQETFRRTR